MHVVSHEHVRVDETSGTRSRFPQALQIKPPVSVAEEACRAIVAALDDVQRYASQF
jgi:hypothetical protein